MSGSAARRLVLIALLAAGAWLMAGARTARPGGAAVPQWPRDDAVYAVDGWTAGPESLQEAWGVAHVTRELRSAGGTAVTVLLSTNASGKGIIGNAETAFRGTGYAVTPAPPGLLPAGPPGRRAAAPVTAVLARGPESNWFIAYAYGARGGPVPDAARGWALVLRDAALGRPNDYFLLRVMTRGDTPSAPPAAPATRETAALAEALAIRLAAWYAR